MNDFIKAFSDSDIPARIQKLQGTRFSDIEDAAGRQYVDLVQEGGGVLGIALTGYTHVLEQAGIRLFSLAGTSAGAINTMMMASLGLIAEAKSERLLRMLSEQDLFELVDGSPAIRKLIRKLLEKDGNLVWSLLWSAIPVYRALRSQLGLNPGDVFVDWISREMEAAGIKTYGDLQQQRKQLPEGLKHIGGRDISDIEAKLALIASDITTHTKVEFPRMAPLYWDNVETVNPAGFVRASMAIPFFFTPYTVADIPNAGQANNPLWDEFAGYSGPVPKEVKFVDGGMLSNFPINVFHRKDSQAPTRPTFGVRLSTYRDNYTEVKNIWKFSGAMVSTMRQIYDYDFLLRNPDYSYLICRIDADEEFNWLDFNITPERQVALFMRGCRRAIEFLEEFDWEKYKQVREELASTSQLAHKKTDEPN